MADWDADDFEPEVPTKPVAAGDKWEGEDEDDEIKQVLGLAALVEDNWDDEDEEGEKKSGDESGEKAVARKKKRTLKEVLAEKEEKKRKEMEERKRAEEEAAKRLTPEELAAEKLRQQRLQEDSDLEIAKDAFGIGNDSSKAQGAIDAYEPITLDDFTEFKNLLKDKILRYERSGHYISFLEQLFRDCSAGLDPEDIKRLGSALNTLANEKQKKEKAVKGKGKKKGGKPKVSEGGELDDYGDAYDEYEDFI